MSEEPSFVAQDDSEANVIFIHSKLDDVGLTANEFRIFAHLSRRAHSAGKAWPGVDSMAKICRMHKETVIDALRSLEASSMIVIERSPGKRSVYRLTAPSKWVHVGNGERSEMGNAPVGNGERGQSEMGNVRKSKEGNPRKDAAAAAEPSIESKVSLPPCLDTDAFAEAFQDWISERSKKRIKPYTVAGANAQLAILAVMGQERAIAAIKYSIAQGFQGIYEAKTTHPNIRNGSDRNAGTYNHGTAPSGRVERLTAQG